MDIVLFGIQGSGKGTQAKRLAAAYGWHSFEAGGELRSIAASGTELGNTVKGYIDQGHLVPHDIIMRVVQEAICARPKSEVILFDGVPRDLDQMRDFNRIMEECGRAFRCVELHVDEPTVINRLRKRAAEQGRADDAKDEFILRRMTLFHEKTEPVIAAYREAGRMSEVDGDAPEDEVFSRMKAALGLV